MKLNLLALKYFSIHLCSNSTEFEREGSVMGGLLLVVHLQQDICTTSCYRVQRGGKHCALLIYLSRTLVIIGVRVIV